MTFVEFKKLLLDAEISLPKFAQLIKVSEKNIQACKKKEKFLIVLQLMPNVLLY